MDFQWIDWIQWIQCGHFRQKMVDKLAKVGCGLLIHLSSVLAILEFNSQKKSEITSIIRIRVAG